MSADEQVGWWETATGSFFGMDDGEYPTEADYGPGFKRVFVRGDAAVSPEPPPAKIQADPEWFDTETGSKRSERKLARELAVEPPQPETPEKP